MPPTVDDIIAGALPALSTAVAEARDQDKNLRFKTASEIRAGLELAYELDDPNDPGRWASVVDPAPATL